MLTKIELNNNLQEALHKIQFLKKENKKIKTEEKRVENEYKVTIEILRIINENLTFYELLKSLILFFKNLTGCEAVGIRLKENSDYPYFECMGFSKDFINKENSLCIKDLNGQILRDEIGNPVLECMCGNILCGRIDTSKPFFTENGSFWSNCTTELLATTTEEDRKARTRNRCNGEGYESVALIPIKKGSTIYGLLQLNDKKKNRFTLDLIKLFEKLCNSIAIALAECRTDASLRESEKQYHFLFDNILNGFAYCKMIFENDIPKDFIYIDVNSAFEKLTGLKDVKGKKVSDVIPGITEADKKIFEIYGRVALTGIPEIFEIYLETLKMWFSVSVYSPEKEYFAAVFEVITERKQAEEEIKKLNADLEKKIQERTQELKEVNKELEAFCYSVSHDLKAPLRAIDGFSKILFEKSYNQFDEDSKRYFDIIRKNTENMANLIDDLLSFSRIGRIDMKLSNIKMDNLIKDIFNEQILFNQDRNVKFIIKSAPQAFGDIAIIKIALTNLMSNSIKFTKNKTEAIIEFGGKIAGDEAEFFLKDNGVGFDMKYVDKLFGVFQRLHRQEEFDGTGIGLALVQRIINRHKGKIWADSKINEGSIFYFTLPIKGEIND